MIKLLFVSLVIGQLLLAHTNRSNNFKMAGPNPALKYRTLHRDLTSEDQVYLFQPDSFSTTYDFDKNMTGKLGLLYVWEILQREDGKLFAVPCPMIDSMQGPRAAEPKPCPAGCGSDGKSGTCVERDNPNAPGGCSKFCFSIISRSYIIKEDIKSKLEQSPVLVKRFKYSLAAKVDGVEISVISEGTTSGKPEKRNFWCGGYIKGEGCFLGNLSNVSKEDQLCAVELIQNVRKKIGSSPVRKILVIGQPILSGVNLSILSDHSSNCN